jgi:hypothetical protein
MILPSATNRKWKKPMWKYMHRLGRCMDRALRESKSFQNNMAEMTIYGTSIWDSSQYENDQKRIIELMNGLKP